MIAWAIAGVGMLMLALVFQTLSRRKPELDAGIYSYAKEGFGAYAGFVSAFGYWIGACLADVACLVLIKATLGKFYLSWSLLSAEVMYSAAKNESMPKFLARENARKVPAAALWMTNAMMQLFLLVSHFAEYAFVLALKMTSAMILLPYLLIAAYALKLAHTGETYAAQPAQRAA